MTGRQRSSRVRTSGNLVILLGLGLMGCDRQGPAVNASKETPTNATAQNTALEPPGTDPRMQQSFTDATRQEPPGEWQRPPDLTLTGKSVGKLYTEVVTLWDTIHFNSEDGQPIHYTATLDTEMGGIEIALRSDLAPNHVRNFVALARAGYYDGLVFERAVHAKSEESPEGEIEVLEAGCPLGTGDSGFGSIGYWLKAEFGKETHEAGTVGAARGADLDTAACKFYITVSKAPFLDGNFTIFGKVTQGLEVARRIFSRPVRNDPEYPEGDRPEKPVVIRKVTIRTANR